MPPKILDCTLRDGGYVNQWNFSKKQATDTVLGLIEAQVDIIECGFLDKTVSYSYWSTRFQDTREIDLFFKHIAKQNSCIVAMIEYGKFDLNSLPSHNANSSIDGIRFSFRKSDWKKSLEEMQQIADKGYKLFVQPITTNSYSQNELEDLLCAIKKFSPYAVYIVDTQGSMMGEDVLRLFEIYNLVLSDCVAIGFHSHNNMQLSYANAIDFVSQATNRELIVDASIYGMGRGAGNLNTELFATYLGKLGGQYNTNALWNLIDRYYHAMHSIYGWGYSIFHYLSASIGCHPDYASYLLDKKHLLIEDIKQILEKIPKDYSYEFNKKIIEDLYFSSNICCDAKIIEPFLNKQHRVVLIGSGKNAQTELNQLKHDNAILIALNHIPQELRVDYVFFNSIKRFVAVSEKEAEGINKIFSSNLENLAMQDDYVLDYQELIVIDENTKSDNSAIMLINYFQKKGFKSIELVGIDGFDVDSLDNYNYQELDCVVDKKALIKLNHDMRKCLDILSKKIKIIFRTKSIFTSEA